MSQEVKLALVVGYENSYLVTSNGNIFRKSILGVDRHYTYKNKGYVCNGVYKGKGRKGNWLKPQFNGKYYHVLLKNRKVALVHRLVAEAFIPNPQNKPYVNHINGNKLDNNVENLEWCTAKENIIHAVKTGLIVKKTGDENKTTRIPEKELYKIREMYSKGIKQTTISKIYGVHQSHISRIVNGHKKGRVSLCQI